jgi:hypothetical protein
MWEAPSTTWKFVTMMPSDLTMKPVPTPRAGCSPNAVCWNRFVTTLTTAGWTRLTTCTSGSSPGATEGAGAVWSGLRSVEAAADGDAVVPVAASGPLAEPFEHAANTRASAISTGAAVRLICG